MSCLEKRPGDRGGVESSSLSKHPRFSQKDEGKIPETNETNEISELKERVKKENEIGRSFFLSLKFERAAAAYKNALRIHSGLSTKLILLYPYKDYKKLSAIINSNMARCYLNMMEYEKGLKYCEKAITEDYEYIKAYVIKGDILMNLASSSRDFDQAHEARECFRRCMILCERLNKDKHFTSQIEEKVNYSEQLCKVLGAGFCIKSLQSTKGKFEAIFKKLIDKKPSEEQEKIEEYKEFLFKRIKNREEELESIQKTTDCSPIGIINNVPEHLECRITLDLIDNPYCTSSGHSYSKDPLLTHIRLNEDDPMTREYICKFKPGLIENKALARAVEDFKDKNNLY
ncbi:unnamed protein product [Moneuplotes crassus]|uniref:RING-type E3 ubiquitin transferase n=1 Tax=Euplotes crassus TaxID=5936 RepID=A0AAD2D5T0_EUPCR|nr:unnamed protein product [Moneuplotes crassus]